MPVVADSTDYEDKEGCDAFVCEHFLSGVELCELQGRSFHLVLIPCLGADHALQVPEPFSLALFHSDYALPLTPVCGFLRAHVLGKHYYYARLPASFPIH